jgi:hypothetical protein
MRFPKPTELLYVPESVVVYAQISPLTRSTIKRRMGARWWENAELEPSLADREIDRRWNWAEMKIEREGRNLSARSLAVVTDDGAVQGAMMMSTSPVECEFEIGKPSLFVELLFTAPGNRKWIRRDRREQFRGVGLVLLETAAELSIESGCAGRLKLESSPDFVDWYKKRGLLEVSKHRIVHEGLKYTPMELPPERVSVLLSER